jgi:uncharacterized membrane protein
MNLVASSLSLPWLVGGGLLFIGALLWAFKTAPWHKVQDDKVAQNVFLAATLIVFLTWQVGASLGDGITFHFLLATTMTLMFGAQFAILAVALATIGVTFQGDLGWLALGVNGLVMGLVPIFITLGLLKIGQRYLELNYFVFLFFNAFLAASLGAVLSLALAGVILWSSEAHAYATLKQVFFPFIPLMATPEGFVNGMLMGALILLKPHWVATFDSNQAFKR